MNKNLRTGGKRPNTFGIVAGVLILLLVFNVIALVMGINSHSSVYVNEYSDLHRELVNGDYPELAQDIRYNEARGGKTAVDTSELAAFARYYEAAVLWKAYTDCGETAKAAEQKAVMDTCAESFTSADVLTAQQNLLAHLASIPEAD